MLVRANLEMYSVLVPVIQKTFGEGSEKGHNNDQRTGKPDK